MSLKGWLKNHRFGRYSLSSLTTKYKRLLEEGAQRTFQPLYDPWDGRWHLLIYSIPETKRPLRRRLRRRLIWLGFSNLNQSTCISPRDLRSEVRQLVDALDLLAYVGSFTVEHREFSSDEEIVARCWDLKLLNEYYGSLFSRYDPLFQDYEVRLTVGDGLDPQECFLQRFTLMHDYRSSPYVDPNLPRELLPEDWLGERGSQLFQQFHELLVDGAETFMDSVLAKAPNVKPRKLDAPSYP